MKKYIFPNNHLENLNVEQANKDLIKYKQKVNELESSLSLHKALSDVGGNFFADSMIEFNNFINLPLIKLNSAKAISLRSGKMEEAAIFGEKEKKMLDELNALYKRLPEIVIDYISKNSSNFKVFLSYSKKK